MRDLAPGRLRDRDEELRVLARFCLADDGPAYLWWQAPAWSGKTALLGDFFLRPPADVLAGVRLVAFFITARLSSQDTRAAFVTAVTGQLADLLGIATPDLVDEAGREVYLNHLLDQAASACARDGLRLVLLVDGLDEDRSQLRGPQARSIAGLLPRHPPSGMRVIVAGRPNPPLPHDVSLGHPLRDPDVVRELAPSPHAEDVARLSRQELTGLLDGTQLEQDVLGLLTAARGGLAVADLADLADASRWDVEAVLHTDSGRTFLSQTDDATGTVVFLLGHQELQVTATGYFGRDRLLAYQARLHAWAHDHHTRGWPDPAPAYLLGGYFRLLADTADTDRLTALAGSSARHNLMRALTGGDAAALAETRTALKAIAADPAPDLSQVLRLTWHQEQLKHRNRHTPEQLPVVWAKLGRTRQALALSEAIGPRSHALTLIAVGRYEEAERLIRSALVGTNGWASAVTDLVVALAEAGEYQRAYRIAGTTSDPQVQSQALNFVAQHAAGAGQIEAALACAEAIPHRTDRVNALVDVAENADMLGRSDLAQEILAEAGRVVGVIDEDDRRAAALARLALTPATGSDQESAHRTLAQAMDLARSVRDIASRASALCQIGEISLRAGLSNAARRCLVQIQALLELPYDQSDRYMVLSSLLQLAVPLGEVALAEQTVAELYDTLGDEMLYSAIRTIAEAGRFTLAEEMLKRFVDPHDAADFLSEIAEIAAAAQQHATAARLARAAVDLSSWMAHRPENASALARAGLIDQAEQIATQIDEPTNRAIILTDLALSAIEAGQQQRAARFATQVEEIVDTIAAAGGTPALGNVARSLAEHGRINQSAEIALSLDDLNERTPTLAAVAREAARAGQFDTVRRLVAAIGPSHRWKSLVPQLALIPLLAGDIEQTRHLIDMIDHDYSQDQARSEVIEAVLARGDVDSAVLLLGDLKNPGIRSTLVVNLVRHAARAGHISEALQLSAELADPARRTSALADIAEAAATQGQTDTALALAADLPDDSRKAEVLATIAKAVLATGDTGRARRLAAAAAVGGFNVTVRAILSVEPELGGQVFDLITAPHPPSTPGPPLP
ncbi:hypothetical protein KIH74_11025 [Kineosporia sp. J2-2]|uniref:NACHT domain-containing protein n=1 Tax=Kineosporia corallincola TaxID=2835133 RepID=A0ABS5TEF3_9ACTN|nr:hypothetical protein [Kineosporia corallincola]MBT0769455.1 hypothetical protein [Kineosporia corallincola]